MASSQPLRLQHGSSHNMSGLHYLGVFDENDDFTCSGTSCRSDKFRIKSSFKQLQLQINGIMHIVKGKKIGVDGVIGKGTVAGFTRAAGHLTSLKKTGPAFSGDTYSAMRAMTFDPSPKTAARYAWEFGMMLSQYTAHLSKSAFYPNVVSQALSTVTDKIDEAAPAGTGGYIKYGLFGLVGYLAYKKFKK